MPIYIMDAEICENTTTAFLGATAGFGEGCPKRQVVLSSDTSRSMMLTKVLP
ncbi:hypothetical protein FocTR4_00006729 [Fusarium oxysporum f. sp. cubense]|uniref:Uncharacterized protein n=2 Tax=Fusarium oxysporum species complex TaxID=171631 RepID=A0A5C6TLX1_FUSOC|nr:hypothetical protein FocTR4_00006729 [Fusarium oxysporum f. sp. cubense]